MSDETKIIPLQIVKTKETTEEERLAQINEYLMKGLKSFQEELGDGAQGFISIVFDKENQPRIIWAGDFEMLLALGAMDFAKNELMERIYRPYIEASYDE